MRIPMLAIHLNRDILTKGFELNKQTHLVPVLASAVKKAANKAASNGNGVQADGGSVDADGQNKRQKVDGAGDAADLTPKTAKVSLCHVLLAHVTGSTAMLSHRRSLKHMSHHQHNSCMLMSLKLESVKLCIGLVYQQYYTGAQATLMLPCIISTDSS